MPITGSQVILHFGSPFKKKTAGVLSLLPLHNQNAMQLCKPNDSAPQKICDSLTDIFRKPSLNPS